MARNDWQNALNDEDMVAVGATRGAGRGARLVRWLVSLFVIAALTFAAAFYIPLKRAHDKLTGEYTALAGKHDTVSAALQKHKDELSTAEKERNELKATVAETKARDERATSRTEALEKALSATFASAIQNKTVVIRKDAGAVVASIAAESLTGDDVQKLEPQSRVVLCEAAKRGMKEPGVRVEVVAAPAEAVARREGWAQAAKRGEFLGHLLEAECGVSADRLTVRTSSKAAQEIALRLVVGVE